MLDAHIFHGRFVCETHIFHGKNVMEGVRKAQKSPDRGGRGWGKGEGLYGLFRVGFGGGGLLLFFELGDAQQGGVDVLADVLGVQLAHEG